MKLFNLRKIPYGLLLLTAFGQLLIIVFSPFNDLSFQNKTMFGVPLEVMILVMPALLITLWLFYILTYRFLYSVTLVRVHVFTTVFTTILVMAAIFIGINPTESLNERYEIIGNAVQILTLLFLSGQLIYIINLVLGLLSKHRHTDQLSV